MRRSEARRRGWVSLVLGGVVAAVMVIVPHSTLGTIGGLLGIAALAMGAFILGGLIGGSGFHD